MPILEVSLAPSLILADFSGDDGMQGSVESDDCEDPSENLPASRDQQHTDDQKTAIPRYGSFRPTVCPFGNLLFGRLRRFCSNRLFNGTWRSRRSCRHGAFDPRWFRCGTSGFQFRQRQSIPSVFQASL